MLCLSFKRSINQMEKKKKKTELYLRIPEEYRDFKKILLYSSKGEFSVLHPIFVHKMSFLRMNRRCLNLTAFSSKEVSSRGRTW